MTQVLWATRKIKSKQPAERIAYCWSERAKTLSHRILGKSVDSKRSRKTKILFFNELLMNHLHQVLSLKWMHEFGKCTHHSSCNSNIPLSLFWKGRPETQSCLQGSWKVWRTSIHYVNSAALREISSMYTNTWEKGAKGMEPDYFQWCPVTGWGNGHTLKYRALPLNTFFLLYWAPVQVVQGGRAVSLLGDTQKPSGHDPG